MSENMELIASGSKKRERSTNFTKAETQLLADLVVRFRTVIENKKTDAVTNKEKEAAWEKITAIFNASSGVTARNFKTLKLKYEGIKKETKKKASQHRQQLYGTGGGPSTAVPFSDVEEKILGVCSSITGLDARNDSDTIETHPVRTEIERTPDIVIEVEQNPVLPNYSWEMEEEAAEGAAKTAAAEIVVDDPATTWQTWTPKALKTKVTPALKNRKETPKESFSKKIDNLSAARLELVDLQKQVAQQELKFRAMEHNQQFAQKQELHELQILQKKEEHEARMLHLRNSEKRSEEEHHLKIKEKF